MQNIVNLFALCLSLTNIAGFQAQTREMLLEDGYTLAASQSPLAGYTEWVMQQSGRHMVPAAWPELPGYSNQTNPEGKALISALEEYLDSAQWPDFPEYSPSSHGGLNKISFTDYEHYPMPRACIQRRWCGESLR